jgi:hypothetical protein
MSSFVSRTAVLATFVLAGCGSSSSGDCTGLCALVPASNEVSGWTRSGNLRLLSDSQAMQGYNDGGLDGAAEPFHDAGLAQVAVQNFANGSGQIILRVWQLNSTGAATTAFQDARTGYGSGTVLNGVGDAGRILDDGVNLTVDVRKGVYFIFAEINSNTAGANTQIQAMVTAVVTKIH